MKKNILFIAFLLASVVSFAQFPNYTNINGRYKWIAGKFDSTFTLPVGTTPSLRTGGGNAPGAMFYRTTDSTIYQYTGTQWIKLRGGVSPTDTAGIWLTNIYRKPGSDSVFYVKGGSSTFAFRDSVGNAGGGGGGGKIYYFNGGVSMGTIGGLTMYELGDTANTGAAANFTRATTGNLANFITDPGKPGLLQIPAGVWTVDAYLSETGGGANHAQIWIEVEKWDGSTITTIATSPIEEITNGSVIDLYTWSVSIPTTSLAITDRIVIQFYISNTNGKTVTLYTQNGYVGEVHTTFTTGIGSLNGLTAPSQFFATGTSGTDFNISSATATHTFNLPTASATNRGALSTTDWSTFNNKIGGSGTTNYVSKFTASGNIGNSQIFDNGSFVGIGGISSPLGNRFEVIETVNPATVGIRGGGGNFGLNFVDFTTFTGIGTKDIKPLYFYNGDTVRLAISSSGNVGIGENLTADSALMVDKGTHLKRGVRMSGLPTGVGTKSLRINANGQLSIADTLANGVSGTGTTNYVAKFTSSSAIGNSQIFDNGTNVGIGTTNPSGTLDIRTTSGLSFRSQSNDGTATNNAGFLIYNTPSATQSSRTVQLVLDPNGANAVNGDYLLIDYSGDGIANFNNLQSGGYFIWTTGGSERMRITSGGEILVNTTTDYGDYKLQVNGNILGVTGNIDGNDNIASTAIAFNTNGTTLSLNSKGTSGIMTFLTNNTERMRITSGGNVGIGTTNPAELLEVSGSSNIYAKITSSNGANAGVKLNSVGVREFGIFSDGSLRFYDFTASTERMRITSGGNVGIGTTNPTEKLEVNGAIKTAAPSGGTAKPWKFGGQVLNTVVLDTGGYIEVEIDGIVYKLATVILN